MTRSHAAILSIAVAFAAPATAQSTTPSAPPAAAPAPAQSPAAAAKARALELADLLNGERVTRAQLIKFFQVTVPEQMRARPEYRALEAKYPGVIEHVAARMQPVVTDLTLKRMPLLLERVAAVYTARFTPAEVEQILAFYRSPTGLWVVATVAQGTDLSAVLKTKMNDPSSAIRAEDVTGSTRGASFPALVAGMTPERQRAIAAFEATSAGRKLPAANAEIAQIAAAFANEGTADGAQVSKVVIEAIQSYVAEADARAGRAPTT